MISLQAPFHEPGKMNFTFRSNKNWLNAVCVVLKYGETLMMVFWEDPGQNGGLWVRQWGVRMSVIREIMTCQVFIFLKNEGSWPIEKIAQEYRPDLWRCYE